jgi:hypothetical protein
VAEDLVLALEGGGALGAYQCGVYKALAPYLHDGGYRVRAIVGASAGGINSGIIARNFHASDHGVGALERFWQSLEYPALPFVPAPVPQWHAWNGLLTGLLHGNPRVFHPHPPGWSPLGLLYPGLFPLYDNSPLVATMRREVGDYRGTSPLLAVQAMEVVSGKPRLFDSASAAVSPEHFATSATVPFLMGTREIDGEHYWDGGFAPDSLLPAVAELMRDHLDGRRCRVIHVDLYRRDSRFPVTIRDHIWRLKSLLIGGRTEPARASAEAVNAHLDFIAEAERSARRLSDCELKRLVAREAERLAESRQLRLDICSIQRSELPNDPVSSIFDFSPERLQALRRQGELEAAEIFARELGAPPAARRQPRLRTGTG